MDSFTAWKLDREPLALPVGTRTVQLPGGILTGRLLEFCQNHDVDGVNFGAMPIELVRPWMQLVLGDELEVLVAGGIALPDLAILARRAWMHYTRPVERTSAATGPTLPAPSIHWILDNFQTIAADLAGHYSIDDPTLLTWRAFTSRMSALPGDSATWRSYVSHHKATDPTAALDAVFGPAHQTRRK